MTLPSRNADTTALFWANFERTAPGSSLGYLGSTSTGPTVTPIDTNTVLVQAQASLPTTFMQLAGFSTVTVHASATAARATTGMEISLVLDNTGSMKGAPIAALRTSAAQLVNILYGGATQDTLPNLWVAVVPFTAEVNIGNAHTDWLLPGTLDESAYANTSWSGCVFARHQGGHDFDDAPPSAAGFTPFIYPSTLGKYTVKGKVVAGDDDWSKTNITENNQANLPDNTAVGPNLGCDALSVLPLTQHQSTVQNLIAQMVQTYRGGTFINLGLQAGWLTLSPRWQGLWGTPGSPLAYNTPNMQKVIVLMTDGNNEWYSWAGGAPDNQGDADVTAYGRFSQNVLGLSPNTAAAATNYINTSMAKMCVNIKSAGITIYTVLFNHSAVDTSTLALFQNCASSPDDYFLAPTPADLQAAFSTIGTQLASLRLQH